MIADRTTKILLATIALGLWAHVAALLFHPAIADAQSQSEVNSYIRRIEGHVAQIANGMCLNKKIC